MLKENVFKKFSPQIYILNVLAISSLLVFGGQNYSIDSYSVLLDSNVHINNFISAYRYFGALLYKGILALGHNPIVNSTIDIIFFVLVVPIFITLLVKVMSNNLKKEDSLSLFIIDLSIIVSIVNVWFCDILSFPECVTITGVGVSLCLLAVCVIDKSQSFVHCLISCVLLICSTAVYQQFISVYVVFVVALFGLKTKDKNDFKSLFNNYYKPAMVAVISGISYFVIGKIILNYTGLQENSRIALSLEQIIENLIYFATHQHSYLKGRGFFSTELLTILFLLIGIVWFLCVVTDWLKNRKNLKTIVLLMSYAVAYVGTYLSGVLSLSHAARAMFPLFSVFGLFAVGTVAFTNKKIIKGLTLLIVVIALGMNIFKITEREVALKKQNTEDSIWASQVIYEIEKYEQENKTTVSVIEICNDVEVSSAVRSTAFARKAILDLSGNREFLYKSMSEEKCEECFGNKNWSVFDADEQMVFEGETLYLCCY